MVTESLVLQRGFLVRETNRKETSADINNQLTSSSGVSKSHKDKSKSYSGFKSGFLLHTTPDVKKGSSATQKVSTTSKQSTAYKKVKPVANGFTKGFLVSSSCSPKKKLQVEPSKPHRVSERSKDLILLESPSETKSSASFLVIEEEIKTPIQTVRPLITVLQQDGESSDKAETVPTRPLISIVNDDIKPSHHSNDQSSDGILLHEKITTKDGPEAPMMLEVSTSWKGLSESNSTRTMRSSTLEKSHLSSVTTRTFSLLDFQQELTRIKWKDYTATNMDSTIATWSRTQALWAWQWLLSLTGQKHQQPLIYSLLDHHPATVQEYLTTQTPQDRTRALKLIQWIQEYLIQQCYRPNWNASTHSLYDDTWLDVVLPVLAAITNPHRTVLAQEAWTTCLLILDRGVNSVSISSIEVLDRLLNIQIEWKRAKKATLKSQAQITLLQDWIQTNKQYSRDKIGWRQNLVGIPLDDRLGFGGICHLFTMDALASRGHVIHNLAKAWTLLVETSEDTVAQSILWRGILAHLSTIKQLDDETKSNTVDKVIELLPGIKKYSDCQMAISALTLVWSDSNGFPIDLISPNDEALSVSIKRLLGALHHTESKVDWNDAKIPKGPLYLYVAECILHSPDSLASIEKIIELEGMSVPTVWILSHLHKLCSGTDTNISNNASSQNSRLQNYIQDTLFDCIPTSTVVRTFLVNSENMVLKISDGQRLGSIIPKLLGILHGHCTRKEDLCSDIVATIASIMTKILESCIANGILNVLVEEVITFLRIKARSPKDSTNHSSHGGSCSPFSTEWRTFLLDNQNTSDDAFGDTLCAAAGAIIEHPSSVDALTFFGSLVGDDIPVNLIPNELSRTRIMRAIKRLVQFCGNTMVELRKNGSCSILNRLAPLLILRRIPAAYFTIARIRAGKNYSSRADNATWNVVDYISSMLELPGAYRSQSTPEEKRLAAEVAGRFFPFGENTSSFSTFEHFCWPAFSELKREVSAGSLGSSSIPLIQKARLALYITCHSIMKGKVKDEEPWDSEYCKTASFALFVVGIEGDDLEEYVSGELALLQTGCREFFAICLTQSIVTSSADKTRSNIRHGLTHWRNDSSCGPMHKISKSIVNMLTVGSLPDEDTWICSAEHFLNKKNTTKKFPDAQTKTSLWNALALVAQRSNEKDGTLTYFAEATLPWIAKWGAHTSSNASDDGHPLCSAAAMQTTFIVLTRLKSLDCLEHDHSDDYPTMLYKWVLWGIENKGSDVSLKYYDHTLRMAALKLLLALLTIGGTGEVHRATRFGTETLRTTISVLVRLSTLDQDSEIRAFSSHILSTLL